ncbi:hypothetical protein PC119_g17958 [Phytophthora cactorum]|nr:hypothetical protein PC119_g17958 [Phytophthora cactorum]
MEMVLQNPAIVIRARVEYVDCRENLFFTAVTSSSDSEHAAGPSPESESASP